MVEVRGGGSGVKMLVTEKYFQTFRPNALAK